MANTERRSDGRNAVQRTVAVLRALAARPAGASLTELAAATEIPATTLHRILGVLRHDALVRETADGRHALAAGTVALARAYLDGLDLRQEALKLMRPLARRTGETCHLGVLALVHIVCIEQVDGPSPGWTHHRVGQAEPALTTAAGRAILAHSSPHTVEEALAAHARLTGAPADRAATEAALAGVRADGFARCLPGDEPGVHSVAAPVVDHAGHITAGLSVSAPAARVDAEAVATLGPQVRAAADELSRQLGWTGAAGYPPGDPYPSRRGDP